MLKSIASFSFLLLLCYIGCSDNSGESSTKSTATTPAVQDYEAMANDLCACMKPMMDLQNNIVEYSAAGDTLAIQQLLNQVEEISIEGDKCVERLEKKHGIVTEENEPKASAAFEKACPEIAALIRAGENLQ